MNGQLYTVSAPSGAGKTSLVRQLVQRVDNLEISVSHTTRPMRPGERDGADYHFVDRPDFERMIAAEEFLEHASVFENYYGTRRANVEAQLRSGTDILLEIDWQGAEQVKRLMPDTVAVFILPPSREALLERLRGRGQDSDEVIARRTQEAVNEMQHYASADYLIINDQFDVAVGELVALVQSQRLRLPRQDAANGELIKNLIN
ncbi:MAG TPA: guanylate kinase, partial [Gammaproteobacteria bacterium]|nr:guanylate kinase [Gammaproteobacteria bacterium]